MRSMESIYILWMESEGACGVVTIGGGTDNGAILSYPFVLAKR